MQTPKRTARRPAKSASAAAVPPPQPSSAQLSVYSLYVQTAEKVSDRRGGLNTWMIALLNALVALDVYFTKLSDGAGPVVRMTVLATPVLGMVTALVWLALLKSYSALNGAKFGVIFELEKEMGIDLFQRERAHYKAQARKGFSQLEANAPLLFLGLFLLLAISRLTAGLGWNGTA